MVRASGSPEFQSKKVLSAMQDDDSFGLGGEGRSGVSRKQSGLVEWMCWRGWRLRLDFCAIADRTLVAMRLDL